MLQRTYPHIEIIVQDNLSTDETVDILNAYAPRLTRVIREKDQGQSDALRRGYARATGEILGWLNADDLLMPNAVERVVAALRARSRDFDVLGRISDDEFAVLLPEPGAAPSERVAELARAVADDVSKDESINDPIRVSLAFGYATVPTDGTDRDRLLERARIARIHMV